MACKCDLSCASTPLNLSNSKSHGVPNNLASDSRKDSSSKLIFSAELIWFSLTTTAPLKSVTAR